MKLSVYIMFVTTVLLSACSKDGDINLFTVKQDIEFGEQLDSTIRANPNEYPLLDEAQYPQVYEFMNGIFNHILSSDEIYYRDEFPWDLTIIDSDVLNAFAAPGGKLYFYTGLMKYLNNTSEIAGVMAHEVAHSDRRHSSERLTKKYSISVIAGVLLGKDPGLLTEIIAGMAQGIVELQFSQKDEHEADEYAVRYLYDVYNTKKYEPYGLKGFFEQMQEDAYIDSTGNNKSGIKLPAFLSTHPSDPERIANIEAVYNELDPNEVRSYPDLTQEYTNFLNLLP